MLLSSYENEYKERVGIMSHKYRAVSQGFHGPITVELELDEQGNLLGVTSEFNPAAKVEKLAIEQMKQKMLTANSVDVDVVTGASSSAASFKQAAKKALALAQNKLSQEDASDAKYKLAKKTGSQPMFTATGLPVNTSDVQAAIKFSAHKTAARTYDVVIIGSGGAGLAAAVEAGTAHKSVLICEKAGISGGTTNFSGGVVQAAATKYQQEFTTFKDDTAKKHAAYYLATAEGLADDELVTDLANHAAQNIDWLAKMGVKWVDVYGNNHVPNVSQALHADRIHVNSGGGNATDGVLLTQALLKRALELGVEIEYECPVQALVYDENKEKVVGVKTKQAIILANDGVIIATAGIDHNPALAKDLNPQHFHDLQNHACMSITTDTGDGIILGQSVGAALCGLGGTIDFDGRTGNATNNKIPSMPMFFVNGAGKRFICEDATYAYGFRAIFQEEQKFGKPTYMIFADSSLEAPTCPWDKESLATDVAAGKIIQAPTIEQLATKLKLSTKSLTDTLLAWNELAKARQDDEFGRQMGLEPLTGNFYAHKNQAANLGAIGGLKINAKGQVLAFDGQVIKGLYAAGLVTGGWMGTYYPGSGTALAGIIHQGRRAAATISQTKY